MGQPLQLFANGHMHQLRIAIMAGLCASLRTTCPMTLLLGFQLRLATHCLRWALPPSTGQHRTAKAYLWQLVDIVLKEVGRSRLAP